jgi:hypothetical protein
MQLLPPLAAASLCATGHVAEKREVPGAFLCDTAGANWLLTIVVENAFTLPEPAGRGVIEC